MAIRRSFTILATYAAMLLAAPVCLAQDPFTGILRGMVLDAKEDPVRGARVEISDSDAGPAVCYSGGDGRFECRAPEAGVLKVTAAAEGFRAFATEAPPGSFLTIVLAPAPLRETVVVSAEASPGAIGETAASISVLDASDIRSSAAVGVDDLLRQTAGFTLFRRTNSRTANPTTQGASLRGINPSGASRSLVLVDSAPLNDPFGGWVPWASVPAIGLEAVEVLRGGASSLYGSDSIGGTVLLRRRNVAGRSAFSAEGFGGTQETGSGSVFAGIARDVFEVDLTGSLFSTGGYVPVEEGSRGSVDERAGSRNALLSSRFTADVFGFRPFVRGTYFRETRRNGTTLQRNALLSRRLEAGADPDLPDLFPGTRDTAISLRAFATFQVFDQSFTSVADDRNSESLVRIQRVPSQVAGFSARFATTAGINGILAGFELDETRGASDESGFFNGNPTTRTGSGGRERNLAVYFQDRIAIGERLIVTGRLRVDSWKNFGALSASLSLASGNISVTEFPDREETSVSPGASAWISVTERVSAYFSASRSFRAPTLNELYRGFRVGDVVTLANEDLVAETSVNLEGGAAYWSELWGVRAAVFSSSVSDSVTNVTIDPGSSPILRQRRNAAEVDVTGLEIEAELRKGRFAISGGYLLADSRYGDVPAATAIQGNRLPQSPVHSVTGQIRYEARKGRVVGVQARFSSEQFDDDLNRFRLGPYFQADLFVSVGLSERARLFASIENILNSRYAVGLTPVRTVAAPFAFRAGIRWN